MISLGLRMCPEAQKRIFCADDGPQLRVLSQEHQRHRGD